LRGNKKEEGDGDDREQVELNPATIKVPKASSEKKGKSGPKGRWKKGRTIAPWTLKEKESRQDKPAHHEYRGQRLMGSQ